MSEETPKTEDPEENDISDLIDDDDDLENEEEEEEEEDKDLEG
jgi:hypothetical protein